MFFKKLWEKNNPPGVNTCGIKKISSRMENVFYDQNIHFRLMGDISFMPHR